MASNTGSNESVAYMGMLTDAAGLAPGRSRGHQGDGPQRRGLHLPGQPEPLHRQPRMGGLRLRRRLRRRRHHAAGGAHRPGRRRRATGRSIWTGTTTGSPTCGATPSTAATASGGPYTRGQRHAADRQPVHRHRPDRRHDLLLRGHRHGLQRATSPPAAARPAPRPPAAAAAPDGLDQRVPLRQRQHRHRRVLRDRRHRPAPT